MTQTEPLVTQVIDEAVIEGKRLGRHVWHDLRSLDYPAEVTTVASVKHAIHGDLPLDQGNIGSCTANALCGALMTDPFWGSEGDRVLTEDDAVAVYHDETELHPQNGVYPPDDPGGCGLWVAKVAKNRGWVKGYTHAFGLQHALGACTLRPCIIGINWYDSFDNPPVNGIMPITPNASVRGGHEILVHEVDAQAKTITILNSWGKGWGHGGNAKFTWDTFDRLLHEQGDCTQLHPIA